MPANARARVAAHPAGGNHQNRELRRQVVRFSDHRVVRCDFLDRGWWMLDGHDSHNSFSLGEWGASSIPSTALNTCRVLMHPKNPSAKVVSRVFASARIDVNCASINFFFLMSIKSDK